MLYEPARHEPLNAPEWSEHRARETIRAIMADCDAAMDDDGTWPWHPCDRDVEGEPRHKSIYLGAAGVLWSLWALQRAARLQIRNDPVALAGRLHASYVDRPDTGAVVPSYFLGEVGLLLVAWRLTGSTEASQRMAASIRANVDHPANEPLWGAPGTMLAALHLWRATGEVRWRALFLESAETVWRAWSWRAGAGCHLWTQDLYGNVDEMLGAAHGFAGNAYALLQAADLLDGARRDALYERCARTLEATVEVEEGAANWPPGLRASRASRKRLLQWCHGAPGIVTALDALPARRSPVVDRLLLQAGTAIWRAGPLAKGSGLCHGTAGNGFAFLKLHRRTGDELWLQRARAFAMHAIWQSEAARDTHRQRRYTLWTGDAGVAWYLWSCVAGTADLPLLDTIDAPPA